MTSLGDRVLRVIRRHAGVRSSGPLTSDLRLRDDLGFDSLRMVALIFGLEEEFGRTLPDSVLQRATIHTVGDVLDTAGELLHDA